MSIINDALKKIQNNRDHSKKNDAPLINEPFSSGQKTWQPPVTPLSPNSIPRSERNDTPAKPAGKRWFIIIFLEILVLCLVVWILFVMQPKMFSFLTKQTAPTVASKSLPSRTTSPAVVSAQPQTTPAPATIITPAVRVSSNNKIILNGVMKNEDKMVALINGEIYEVGDFINDKEISKITLDGVELRDGDKITVLNVR